MTPVLRPGTYDAESWDSVYTRNEYQLPGSMAGVVVLDIGAHVGAFSCLCLDRGARAAFAYEASAANAQVLARNLAGYHNARPCRAAVWRSDQPSEALVDYRPHRSPTHTGGGAVAPVGVPSVSEWEGPSEPVPAHSFDAVLHDAAAAYPGAPIWVKLDCEGSEFPILLTSRMLHVPARFVGEYHLFYPRLDGLPPVTTTALAEAFAAAGKHATFHGDPAMGLGRFEAE